MMGRVSVLRASGKEGHRLQALLYKRSLKFTPELAVEELETSLQGQGNRNGSSLQTLFVGSPGYPPLPDKTEWNTYSPSRVVLSFQQTRVKSSVFKTGGTTELAIPTTSSC